MSSEQDALSYPDFSNTEIAFHNKSNKELKATERLFTLMNNNVLVDIGSNFAKLALKLRLPFVETIIKKTIFKQFCGGLNLMDCQEIIDEHSQNNILSLLDYGVEAKSKEEDFEEAHNELMNAIDFAASNHSIPAAICKMTAIVSNELLIKCHNKETLSQREQGEFERFKNRIDAACNRAYDLGVGIFFDAEESWLQNPIDELTIEMMAIYNKDKVVVYNTYQLYKKDCLAQLKFDFENSLKGEYLFGAKLVRGAYMEKERERAIEKGYPSPIHDTKEDTDADFNAALLYCLDDYTKISVVCASHNMESNNLLAKAVIDRELPHDHPHINFSQLQGMSDYISYNLAKKGFNVAKYVVYGPIKDVSEYLIRRAEENTSITGEASRELRLIREELKRRRIS